MSEVCEFATEEGKEWLKGLLKTEIVTVKFEKSDGSIREMRCTLKEGQIPEEKMPKNSGKKHSDEVQPVFDLENQGWRSFRFDSVKEVRFTLGEVA